MIIERIKTLGEAEEFLKSLDIEYDWIGYHPIRYQRNEIYIHLYFMVDGVGDVAYYTPDLDNLFINRKVRIWDTTLMNDLRRK